MDLEWDGWEDEEAVDQYYRTFDDNYLVHNDYYGNLPEDYHDFDEMYEDCDQMYEDCDQMYEDYDQIYEDLDHYGEGEYEDPETLQENPVKSRSLYCSLCNCTLPDARMLLTHVLSASHNRRLQKEKTVGKDSLIRSLLEKGRKRKKSAWKSRETILTKKLKYFGSLLEVEEGVTEDDDSEDDDEDYTQVSMDIDEETVKLKPVKKESKPSITAAPSNPNDLRNRLIKMKEKQDEERKAEKRKKKNVRTREAKKRNKQAAKEDKKRIEKALEALEEEDEDVAYMKQTMGFSKFQTTKTRFANMFTSVASYF